MTYSTQKKAARDLEIPATLSFLPSHYEQEDIHEHYTTETLSPHKAPTLPGLRRPSPNGSQARVLRPVFELRGCVGSHPAGTGHSKANAMNTDVAPELGAPPIFLQSACKYAEFGFHILPICRNSKRPAIDNWTETATTDLQTVSAWWLENPNFNIGCLTGWPSGNIVLDLDPSETVSIEDILRDLDVRLGETLTAKTPSGGLHIYYRLPEGLDVRRRIKIRPGLDIMADKSQVLLPPSSIDGVKYEWHTKKKIQPLPQRLLALLREKPKKEVTGADGGNIPEGQRNNALTIIAGRMRRAGAGEAALLVQLREHNKHCSPPLDDRELQSIAKSVARYETSITFNEVRPLPKSLPAVPEFDLSLLPSVLAPVVAHISESTQAPPDYAAVTYMAVACNLLSRHRAIRPKARDDWTVISNLWGMIIGRPSAMKTPSTKPALQIMDRLEEEAFKDSERARLEYEQQQVLHDGNVRANKDLIKSESKKKSPNVVYLKDYARKITVEKPDPPPIIRHWVSDPTVEALGAILVENPSIFVFRDELRGFLAGLERHGQEAARAFYLEAWGGDRPFSFERIGRGRVRIPRACVSVFGGIQPSPLKSLLKESMDAGRGNDGLIQRFQLAVWPDLSPEFRLVDKPLPAELAMRVAETFGSFSRRPHGLDEQESLAFHRFDPEAQERFNDWYTKLQLRLREGQMPECLEAHLGKFPKLVPALALACELCSHQDGAISSRSLVKAIGWAEYLEAHARRIYSSVMNSEIVAAHALVKKLSILIKRPFTARDLYRKGWSDLTDPLDVQRAAELLVDHGWLGAEEREIKIGRPTTVYWVNPEAMRH